jgi:glycosyltransferase involved in cell wall biosynthesis
MSDSDAPLVSCMMMTGGSPERRPLAQIAVRSFQQQTYAPRELVIINQSLGTAFEKRVLAGIAEEGPGYRMREYLVPKPTSLGDLRNIGLDRARGTWLMSWDDDDWSHSARISRQMAQRASMRPVAFTTTVRCSLQHNTAFVHREVRYGNGGLLLFPTGLGRYPAQDRHEDSDFYLKYFRSTTVLWDNADFPEIYVRFYHGNNTSSETHILGSVRGARRRMPELTFLAEVPAHTQQYVRTLLKTEYAQLFPVARA